MKLEALTNLEVKRFHKHIILPEIGIKGQEKLKNSSVLVIGAGSLGTPVLQYLAVSGIGKIGIVDDDKVEEKNLQCQLLYSTKDLGKHKVIIARQRLEELNPGADFEILILKVIELNVIELIKPYDLIIDTTNRFSTHYVVDDACKTEGKSWVYGTVKGYRGEATVFNYSNGPALRDLYPDEGIKEDFSDPYQAGILGVLPGLVGSILVAESIKVLLRFGEVLSGKLISIDLRKNQYSIIII